MDQRDHEVRGGGTPHDAFGFTGTWQEYLPIALSNLLLTIVTVGVYRFWAKARERRYLWSRTRFIDDRLEWTGTGLEMFKGFVIVMAVIALPFLFLNFGFQALILRGQTVAAGALFILLYLLLLWFGGFAQFRALRYRLARTFWHGIRGGAEDPGFAYAVTAAWKPLVAAIPAGVFMPWAMVSLWNARWNAMSFGPNRFTSNADWGKLMLRWLLMYVAIFLIPFALLIVIGMVAGGMIAGGALDLDRFDPNNIGSIAAFIVLFVGGMLATYALVALIGLGYYAAYFREGVSNLRLGELEFVFTARSKHWILLFLGDVALLLLTLGLGICFLGYRHWSFFIRHLGATGEVDLTSLTQSRTLAPREAEGFADAFDVGAI